MNAASFFYSDRIVQSMTKGQDISEDGQPALHRIVSGLALAAGIPKPKVAVIESNAPNAFATGRGPGNSVVAVTTGCWAFLNESELEGVLSPRDKPHKAPGCHRRVDSGHRGGAISYLALVGAVRRTRIGQQETATRAAWR
jgi:hypothetical protein